MTKIVLLLILTILSSCLVENKVVNSNSLQHQNSQANSGIKDQVTYVNTPLTVPFNLVTKLQDYSCSQYSQASSSNASVVRNSDLEIVGSGPNCYLIIRPVNDVTGNTTLTLNLNSPNQVPSLLNSA